MKIRRMEGVCGFLDRQGAPVRSKWIVPFKGLGPNGEAPAAAERFFKKAVELPTAFVCSSDEDALQLIQIAEKHNIRVPHDLSVVGFDNSSVAQLQQVSLTSVDHPSFSMGELVTNILSEKVSRPKLNSSPVPSLPRQSSNAPRFARSLHELDTKISVNCSALRRKAERTAGSKRSGDVLPSPTESVMAAVF